MDEHPITNEEFARFVAATSYITVAERSPDSSSYSGAERAAMVPGSLVFQQPTRPVRLQDARAWWDYVPGACWRCPEGANTEIEGREHHPVAHIAFEDAGAYARWARKGTTD